MLKTFLGVPFHHPSIIVVISPLLGLIDDQIERFSRMGLACTAPRRSADTLDDITRGGYQVIFMTPEMLNTMRHRGIFDTDTVGGKSLVTFAFVKTNTKFCSVPFRFSLSLRSALLQFYCVNCERIPRTY